MHDPEYLALFECVMCYPEEDLPRLVLADYLDERDAVVPCGVCRGTGWTTRAKAGDTYATESPYLIPDFATVGCPRCDGRRDRRGTGSVPNGFADRAELIRVGCGLAALESQAADLLDDETDWSACTGIAASWCPNCGDCSCLDREESMSDPGCPLHAPSSRHCCLETLNDKITRFRDRESALLAANAERWVVPILYAIWPGTGHTQAGAEFTSAPGGRVNGSIRFARGFLDRVSLTLADLTDTAAAVLGAAGPLDGGVELRDRRPEQRRNGYWGWYAAGGYVARIGYDQLRHAIPQPVYILLPGTPERPSFTTRAVAVNALDTAAASFCRLAAGFPALPQPERIGAK